jgi:hypothetical protein
MCFDLCQFHASMTNMYWCSNRAQSIMHDASPKVDGDVQGAYVSGGSIEGVILYPSLEDMVLSSEAR